MQVRGCSNNRIRRAITYTMKVRPLQLSDTLCLSQQKRPQNGVCLIRHLLRQKMPAWQRLATHICGILAPDLQDVLCTADVAFGTP